MSKTTHFQNSPLQVTVEANKKFAYCRCGYSDIFPSCDGSHKTCGGTPLKFTLEQQKTLTLCRCGQSNDLPHCDGSHLK